MNKDLKPCPFCGNPKNYTEFFYHEDMLVTPYRGRVSCPYCWASVPSEGFFTTGNEAIASACTNWNKRAEVEHDCERVD